MSSASKKESSKGWKPKAKRKGGPGGDTEMDAASFGSSALMDSKSDDFDAMNGVKSEAVCGFVPDHDGATLNGVVNGNDNVSYASSSSSSSSTSLPFPSADAPLHALKTLVELAEVGLLRDLDIGLGLGQGTGDALPRPVGPSPHHPGSNGVGVGVGAQAGRYRAHLAEQVHEQWADDTISLHHREHVARLVDVERNLNERIAHLRRALADPEASSEDAHRKRQGEVNRSIIGRLVKFRKKERLQAQMATKIQRRHHKARAAVASKAATTDEEFVE